MSNHEITDLIKLVAGSAVLPPSTVAGERMRDACATPRFGVVDPQEAC